MACVVSDGSRSKRRGSTMGEVVSIAPVVGEPGLTAYECLDCVYVTSGARHHWIKAGIDHSMSPDEARKLWADLCECGWHRVSDEEIIRHQMSHRKLRSIVYSGLF